MSDELEQTILQREVAFDLEEEGDGRTLHTRIVPYNTPAEVSDPPDFTPYKEVWLPGAFDKQLKAANRVDVFLNFEHEPGIRGVVGRGTNLLSDPSDGLHGQFRILQGSDGDKTLELVNEGVLRGMSIEARAIKSSKVDDVVYRKEARLLNVAITRTGKQAYKDAAVLAIRTETEEQEEAPAVIEPQVFEPVKSMAVDETLQRLGWAPLVSRAVVDKPWDGSASRFTDEQYERSCLIDRGGDDPPKTRCSLPVLEPNGDLNVVALAGAAAVLAGGRGGVGNVSPEQKAAAARKAMRYYTQAGKAAPPALRVLAGK